MKILITGGCGFVGKHLARKLAQRNEVVALDTSPDFSMEGDGIRVVEGDVLDESVWKMLGREGFDVVIHLAAKISVLESLRDPRGFMDVNVGGTRKAVQMAREWGSELVFFSSAAVYGDYMRPVREDDALNPISPYGKSKALAEEIAKEYEKSLILRPGNIYGPGKRHKGVVELFVERACNRMPLVVRGGEQVRDFIHVMDVVAAVEKMIGVHGIFNLGTGEGTSINALAEIVREECGNAAVEREDMPAGDISYSVLDISRLSRHFRPGIGIREGVKMLIRSMKSGSGNA